MFLRTLGIRKGSLLLKMAKLFMKIMKEFQISALQDIKEFLILLILPLGMAGEQAGTPLNTKPYLELETKIA